MRRPVPLPFKFLQYVILSGRYQIPLSKYTLPFGQYSKWVDRDIDKGHVETLKQAFLKQSDIFDTVQPFIGIADTSVDQFYGAEINKEITKVPKIILIAGIHRHAAFSEVGIYGF